MAYMKDFRGRRLDAYPVPALDVSWLKPTRTASQDDLWLSNGARWGIISQLPVDRATIITPSGAEGAAVQEATPYFDTVLGKWCVVYTGGYGAPRAIYYATADALDGTWTKAGAFIGGGLGGESGPMGHTNVHVEGSTVYLFYPASPDSPGGSLKSVSWPLGQAPGPSNLTSPVTVFTPSAPATLGVANSSILKDDDGTYVLAFEYWASNAAGFWNIGYATASTLLGPYTQQIAPWSTLQRATASMFGGPRLMKEDGLYVIWHHAASRPVTSAGTLPTDIYRATAPDLADHWTSETPRLVRRAVGIKESGQVADVRLVTDPRTGARYATWSQFNNTSNAAAIGMSRVLPVLLTWDTATSTYRKVAAGANPGTAKDEDGSIRGIKDLAPSSDVTAGATSTSFVGANTNTGGAISQTNVTVRWLHPQGARVLIRATFCIQVAAGCSLWANLRDGSTDVSGTSRLVELNNGTTTIQRVVTVEWPIDDRSIVGATKDYTLGIARKVGSGTAAIVMGPSYGDFIMTVTD